MDRRRLVLATFTSVHELGASKFGPPSHSFGPARRELWWIRGGTNIVSAMTQPDGDTGRPASSSAVSGAVSSLRRRWPALAGIAFAALITIGMVSGVEQAAIIAAATMAYIGCAALQRRAAAWPLFFASAVVITVAKILDDPYHGTLVVLACGAALGAYGLVRGVVRPAHALPLQSIGLLGFGGVAAVALFVDTDLGAYLVAAALLAHAGWDLYHYRANRIVVRSLAEFCLLLDAAVAVLIVVVTVTS
jgi:hypothetical protein